MGYKAEVAEDTLTSEIIAAAIEVHRALGPHQPEAIVRDALVLELEARQLEVEREHPSPITYRGTRIGTAVLDLLIQDEVVVELKVVRRTTDDHFNQLARNTKSVGATRGLLLNFGQPTIDIRRYVNGYGPPKAEPL